MQPSDRFAELVRDWPEEELRKGLTSFRADYGPEQVEVLEAELTRRGLVLPPAEHGGAGQAEAANLSACLWTGLAAAVLLILGYLALGAIVGAAPLGLESWSGGAWATLALVNAVLAQARRRSGGWAFLLSLTLGPLVTLGLALLGPGAHADSGARVRSPVRLNAGRCPYCHDAVQVAERRVCATCLAVHHASCASEHARGCAACGAETLLVPEASSEDAGSAAPEPGLDRESPRKAPPLSG